MYRIQNEQAKRTKNRKPRSAWMKTTVNKKRTSIMDKKFLRTLLLSAWLCAAPWENKAWAESANQANDEHVIVSAQAMLNQGYTAFNYHVNPSDLTKVEQSCTKWGADVIHYVSSITERPPSIACTSEKTRLPTGDISVLCWCGLPNDPRFYSWYKPNDPLK